MADQSDVSDLEEGEVTSDGEHSRSSSSSNTSSDEGDHPRRGTSKRKLQDNFEDPAESQGCSKIDEEAKNDLGKAEPRMKRFKITPKEEECKWNLPDEFASYLEEHIDKFIPDKDLKDKVLDEHPVPANCPRVRKLDEFLSQFLSSHDERLDVSLSKIESRIRDILGPLSKLWVNLEGLNDTPVDGDVELDINHLLEMTHKSIVMLSQTMNATTYQRRLYILSAVCKDSVKAKSQLKEKASLFKGHKYLFGSDYRKNVLALSKEREKAGNMLRAMGLKKKSRRSFPKGSHHREESGARDGGDQFKRTVRIKRVDSGEKKHSNNQGKFYVSRKANGKFFLARYPFRKRLLKCSTSYKRAFLTRYSNGRLNGKFKILCATGKCHLRSCHLTDSK